MLSEEQLRNFHRDGAVIVPGVLGALERGRLLDAVRRAASLELEGFPPRGEPHMGRDEIFEYEPGVTEDEVPDHAARVRTMYHLGRYSEVVRDYVLSDRITAMARQLLGEDEIFYHTDQTFFKAPRYGSDVPWHQDDAYWPVEPGKVVSCWTALDDSTVENGCLLVVPGSHLRGLLPHRHQVSYQLYALAESQFDVTAAKPLVLAAGSCSFHSGLVIHGSRPNRSDRPRRSLVGVYVAGSARIENDWPMPRFRLIAA